MRCRRGRIRRQHGRTGGQQHDIQLLPDPPDHRQQDNRPIRLEKVDVSDALIYAENALGIGMMGDIGTSSTSRAIRSTRSRPKRSPKSCSNSTTVCRMKNAPYIPRRPGRWALPTRSWASRENGTNLGGKGDRRCGNREVRGGTVAGHAFFQNVTSMGVGYLTITPCRGDGIFREGNSTAAAQLRRDVPAAGCASKPLWVCIRRALEQGYRQGRGR